MSVRQCPRCRSTSVHRSRRRGLFEVLVLRPFLLRPYRCWTCFRRHYGYVFARHYTAQVGQRSLFPGLPSEAFQAAPLFLIFLFAMPLLLASSGLALPVLERLGLAGPGSTSRSSQATSVGLAGPVPSLVASHEVVTGPLDRSEWAGETFRAETSRPSESSFGATPISAQQREPIGSLRASGEVYLNEARVPEEAVVFPGDVLRTGAGSAAVLQVPGKGTILISERTRISFAGFRDYFATLEHGAVGFASSGAVRDFEVRIGRFVVRPDPEAADSAADIERAPDGSARVRATRGSVGVIDLEGTQTVFMPASQEVSISAGGTLQRMAPAPPPPVAPAPEAPSVPPPVQIEKATRSRAGWIALGVAGGGAAGAAALLALRSEREAVSPSTP